MLEFPRLRKAAFVERLNRFAVIADIRGKKVIAHLHDPGRLRELLTPGATIYLHHSPSPHRKTDWDVILAVKDGRLVVIYSTMANRLIRDLLMNHKLPGFRRWNLEKTEPRFGKGRFDFLLSYAKAKMLVEVKSVSLVEGGVARFPDAPTTRGRRHLMELASALKRGYRSAVIFVVTRPDTDSVEPNWPTDPQFASTLATVSKKGVRVAAYNCEVSLRSIDIIGQITFNTNEPASLKDC